MKENPTHIGIIVDGNRRWAKEKGLKPFLGHKNGFLLLKQVATWCFENNIQYVTFYIFSTENWKRTKKEIDYLMQKLFKVDLFKKDLEYFHNKNIKILISGRKENLPKSLQETIKKVVKSTKENT